MQQYLVAKNEKQLEAIAKLTHEGYPIRDIARALDLPVRYVRTVRHSPHFHAIYEKLTGEPYEPLNRAHQELIRILPRAIEVTERLLEDPDPKVRLAAAKTVFKHTVQLKTQQQQQQPTVAVEVRNQAMSVTQAEQILVKAVQETAFGGDNGGTDAVQNQEGREYVVGSLPASCSGEAQDQKGC